jgi:hypothetical protein
MDDPRQSGKVRYPLDEILLLCLAAVISGAKTVSAIAQFGETKLTFLRRFKLFKDGTPAHDHLGDILASLDPEAFQRCFVAWVSALIGAPVEAIAIDGKTQRRSGSKAKGQTAAHIVTPFAARQRLVLAQVKVDAKSNEISAIPALIGMIDMTGAVVTIDAMGCQRAISERIVEKKADYVLALKGSQRCVSERCRRWPRISPFQRLRGGCCRDLVGLPIPGQQFVDLLGWMIRKARQDIGEPRLRVDIVELAGLNERKDGGGPASSGVRTCEGPIPTPDGYAPQGAFGGVIGEADAAVVKETDELDPSRQAVIDVLGEIGLGRQLRTLFGQPHAQVLDERRNGFLAHGDALIGGLAGDRALAGEDLVHAAHGLGRDRRLGVFRMIKQFAPPMRPTV